MAEFKALMEFKFFDDGSPSIVRVSRSGPEPFSGIDLTVISPVGAGTRTSCVSVYMSVEHVDELIDALTQAAYGMRGKEA